MHQLQPTKFLLAITFAIVFSLKLSAQVSFGEPHLFNDGWKFLLDNDSTKDYRSTNCDDSSWRKLTLPHDWSIEGTPSPELASCTGYLPGGIGWYRKHFSIEDNQAKHYIYFEGVYNRSEVYLNGHLLGKRPNGYISFMYDLTPYLKKGDNVLAVRVNHSKYADSRWYTGSGIYRDVWLIGAGKTHISQWGVGYVAKNVSKDKATIEINTNIDKAKEDTRALSVRYTILDANGKVAGKSAGSCKQNNISKVSINISNPHLWNLTTPYLYNMKVELLSGNEVIDTTSVRVGIRYLQFDANKGFALNGEWMKVKGVCIHHDAGVLGSAVPREVWYRRFLRLKDIGVNGIRMSHNVQAPVVYDLADQLGFLILDEGSDEWEFAKRKWVKGWNKGEPSYDGTYDFFEEWIDRDITDMVRRDRNHPSVFMWSVGNEVDYPNDPYSHPILDGGSAGINQPMYGGYKKNAPRAERIGFIAKRLANDIRQIDTSRPVTGAMAGVVMSNQTDYPNVIDVCGYNYTEGRYVEDHKNYPNRIIYGSETSMNLSSWTAVRDNPHIFGHFIWTGIEYLGESGAWPSRGLGPGLVDLAGFIKPRGRYFESLWQTSPMAYIGTQGIGGRWGNRGGNGINTDAQDTWNYKEGQTVRVFCYTNQPFARLLLNGKEVGEKKKYDKKNCGISWDVTYEPGTLEVEGIDENGKVVATYSIKTYGEAKCLKAYIDNSGHKSTDSIVHVIIEMQDENGNRVQNVRKEITCDMIEGGELLGIENANNSDMSAPKSHTRSLNRGRALAYVHKTSATAKLQIKAEGMEPIIINL